MELRTSKEGFSGTLDKFSLLDLVQMICLSGATGVLRVENPSTGARILFDRGRIVHAESAGICGEEALFDILRWESGRFALSTAAVLNLSSRTIQRGWEEVLMDAVRKGDELSLQTSSEIFSKPRGMKRPLAADLVAALKRSRQQRIFRRWIFGAIAGAVAVASLLLLVVPAGRVLRHLASGGADRRYPKRAFATIKVRAGPFFFGEGRTITLPQFDIDPVEVTIWEYADFLRAIGSRTDFDHPNQPHGKGHSNPDWEALAASAFSGRSFQGVQITPNFPAVFVDWFDAFAFAKWKGRALPGEEQWEKAARGIHGLRYPWGDHWIEGAANLASPLRDAVSWSEVGSWPNDRSPFGVMDMAGNVSEWTSSIDLNGLPMTKGSNFREEDGDLTRRVAHLSPLTRDGRIGFRTVSLPP